MNIAIDLGGTNIRLGVIENASILKKELISCPSYENAKEVLNQLKILIKNNKVSLKSLVKSAFYETTRVKSVIGAIAEEFDFESDLLNKLKNSLNPLSMVYLNVGDALMYANNWQIRADRK